jgi:acetylornithine deacetylase/succinyl-diaminopimelate desuccinylase-like protein
MGEPPVQEAVGAYIHAHRDEALEVLCRLVRQPSISAQGIGMHECAELLRGVMAGAGIKVRLMETAGYPVVYGEAAGPSGAPTLLIYGHYDVQPPEPLDAWQSPPFEPVLRGGRLFGRGTADNKGQLLAHVLAVGAFQATGTPLPVNLRFLFEGEEESGSPNLPAFVDQHRELLSADAVLTSDGPKHESGRPQVFFGVRGLLYVELTSRGANRDLHSGNKGGLVPNPAFELCRLLATMKRPDGRVAIAGFYDDVAPPTPYERELMAAIPFDEQQVKEDLGVAELAWVGGLSPAERLMFEPTLNVCGLLSGYTGPGSKTIIPARATAKIDMRLVANQDPDDIYAKFCRHVAEHAPGIEVRRLEGGCPPSKTSPELPVCQAVIRGAGRAAGVAPVVLPTLGGSMPDYIFTRVLGLPSIGVPYANWDENNHAPNENLGLKDFYLGIHTTAHILREVAGKR